MDTGDPILFRKRAEELSARAERTGLCFHTEFLTPAEQSTLRTLRLPLAPVFFGGYEGSERVIALFGGAEEEAAEQIACLAMAPKQQKFAEDLSHRDFLGALMHLGIRREVLGDILIIDNVGYLFCLTDMAQYIEESLDRVRNTPVTCRRSEPPAALMEEPEPVSLVVASDRADAIISAAFHLSRGTGKEAIEDGRLFINGRQTLNASVTPKEGDILSVRGLGRVRYLGPERATLRGRLRVQAQIWK